MKDALVQLLPFVLIVAVGWLLLIRPQQRRMRDLGAMQRSLEVGDSVMLTSGIVGTIAALEDDTASVTIADGVDISVVRAAIGQVIEPVAAPTDDSAADAHTRIEETH